MSCNESPWQIGLGTSVAPTTWGIITLFTV